MAGLTVNVDHIATIREIRKAGDPDPVSAAILAELAGADGITVHLRQDRRHIQDRDVRLLKEMVQSKFILKMASTTEMIGIALEIKPDLVTLVPEKKNELTTESGMDLVAGGNNAAESVESLQHAGIPVSILIDPEPQQVKAAYKIGANRIQIHTGTLCGAYTPQQKEQAFSAILNTIKIAYKLKLGITAGHGLCYNTVKHFKDLHEINEFSIGHSIISRAVLKGMEEAVKEMLGLVRPI